MKFKSITPTVPNKVKISIGDQHLTGYTSNLLNTYTEALAKAVKRRVPFSVLVMDMNGETVKVFNQTTPPMTKQVVTSTTKLM